VRQYERLEREKLETEEKEIMDELNGIVVTAENAWVVKNILRNKTYEFTKKTFDKMKQIVDEARKFE